MRVLMTGDNGYIGSVMKPMFENFGHEVIGFDIGYFSETDIVESRGEGLSDRRDIRDDDVDAVMQGVDAIVHLAALSNDPIGNLNETWTRDINYQGTIRLAEAAKRAGTKRFLFSSSCIMYGASSASVVGEDAALDPKTEYARSKVRAEDTLREMASDDFSPTFIRNGTIYGMSPRMRFDTVLNDFVGQALVYGKVTVFSDGKPWRPVVHLKDICRSFLLFSQAPRELIHKEAFNNGSEKLNWRIRDFAERVVEIVDGCELEIRSDVSADQRTYRASFEKMRKTFPNFDFDWAPSTGALELVEAMRQIGLTKEMFESADFTRLKWLRHLQQRGDLNDSLRWTRNY